MKRLALAVLVALPVLVSAAAGADAARDRAVAAEAGRTARAFLEAVVAEDLGRASGLAGPRLGGLLASRRKVARAAREASVSVSVDPLGPDAARALARVEVGDDVLWYDLWLSRRDGAWQVSEAALAPPPVSGWSEPVPRDFDPSAFSRYLDAVGRGDWQAAEREMVGPALLSQQTGRAALGPVGAGLFGGHTPPEVAPLWSDGGRLVLARARYRVDGRKASVLVTFFRTTGGAWRVVQVAQE